jgi:hypothetical protein
MHYEMSFLWRIFLVAGLFTYKIDIASRAMSTGPGHPGWASLNIFCICSSSRACTFKIDIVSRAVSTGPGQPGRAAGPGQPGRDSRAGAAEPGRGSRAGTAGPGHFNCFIVFVAHYPSSRACTFRIDIVS